MVLGFQCLLHMDFYFCVEQINFFFKLIRGKHGVVLCGLKLASENPLHAGFREWSCLFWRYAIQKLVLKEKGNFILYDWGFFLQNFRISVTYAIVCAILASCYSFECSCPPAAWLFMGRSVEFLLISQVFKNINELNITTLVKRELDGGTEWRLKGINVLLKAVCIFHHRTRNTNMILLPSSLSLLTFGPVLNRPAMLFCFIHDKGMKKVLILCNLQ